MLTDSALISSSNSQSTMSLEFATIVLSEISIVCIARLITCAKHHTHWSLGSKLILFDFSTWLKIFIRTLLFDTLSVITAKICNLFQWQILDQCLQNNLRLYFCQNSKILALWLKHFLKVFSRMCSRKLSKVD